MNPTINLTKIAEELLNLNIGDLVIRAQDFGYDHYGIVVGYNEIKEPIVAENQIGVGPLLITITEFLQTYPIKKIEKFSGTKYQRDFVVYRSNNIKKTNYHLFNFNGEEYARFIQTGISKSTQVTNSFAGPGIPINIGLYFMLGINDSI